MLRAIEELIPRGKRAPAAVDFIFGNASAYFDHCTIASNGPGHISAQKRQFNDEDQPIPSAFIFNGCNVVRDWDTNGVNITRKCDLGRPWRSYAKVVYMNSFIGKREKAHTRFCKRRLIYRAKMIISLRTAGETGTQALWATIPMCIMVNTTIPDQDHGRQ